jgi:hypothetical protein
VEYFWATPQDIYYLFPPFIVQSSFTSAHTTSREARNPSFAMFPKERKNRLGEQLAYKTSFQLK